MCLKNIKIGETAAEYDENLNKYFLDTGVSDRILGGPSERGKYLILGRKGAGKSALYLHIKNRLEKEKKSVIESNNVNKEQRLYYTISDKMKEFKDLSVNEVWKFVIYAKIAEKLIKDDKISQSSKVEIDKIFSYLRIKKNKSIFTKILQILNILNPTLEIPGVGSFSPDFSAVNDNKYPYQIFDEFEDLIKREISNHNVHVIIDRIDENWRGSENDKESVLGLVEATHSINVDPDFMKSYIYYPPVILFLRTDIRNSINSSNLNKISYESIEWGEENLIKMIDKRIKANDSYRTNWQDIFLDKDKNGKDMYVQNKRQSARHIYERTMNRPRDMIEFVNKALAIAVKKEHEKITSQDIKDAEQGYGGYIHDELKNEIGTTHSVELFDTGMEILKSINHRYLSIDDWRQTASMMYSLKSSQADDIFKVFISASIIGKKLTGGTNGGTRYEYAYNDPRGNLVYSENDKFCVHLSLIKYLGIGQNATRKGKEKTEISPQEALFKA